MYVNQGRRPSHADLRREGGPHQNGRPHQRKRKRRPEVPPPDHYFKSIARTPVDKLRGSLRNGTYVVFDIETTGGNPERNGITEIFALRYVGGEVVDTLYSMVNPKVPIPGIVRRMTGISNSMVRGAPPIEDVMPKIVEFIKDDILVSHNTIGDLKFLVYFARKVCQHRLDNFFLCTHLLTEKLIPESKDKSLQGLGEFLGLPQGTQHRATEDAYLTLELFKALLERAQEKGFQTIEEAIRLQGDMESGLKLGWGLPVGVGKSFPTSPGVLRFFDRSNKEVFLGSAFNLHRTFASFEQLDAQSRQLQKVLLQSYRVESEAHASIFAAMLAEAELSERAPLRYKPYQWHMRVVPAICLLREKDGSFRLLVSQLESGVEKAYGPVYDKRAAQQLVDAFGRIFAVPVSRKGAVIPQEKFDLVVAFFEGRLAEFQERNKKGLSQFFHLKFWVSSDQRRQFRQLKTEIEQLHAVARPSGQVNLLAKNGLIVAPRVNEENWELYPVVGSVPGAPTIIEGDWRQWLKTSAGDQFLQGIRDRAGQVQAKPLAAEESQKANAMLWIAYSGRHKKTHTCRFHALSEFMEV